MKKIYTIVAMATFCFFLFAGNSAKAQNVNIPDANFKAALVDNGAINTNGDAEIQGTEAQAFTGFMDLVDKGIADLTGIEAFTSITILDCNGNSLTSLNLNANTALAYLNCRNNQLTSLDLSANTALAGLYCTSNQLVSLNLKNGHNGILMYIDCFYNSLTCIQVDDVSDANANIYWYKDASASYSTTCACTSNASDTTATACNSYTWHGVTYYTTGNKTFITTNVGGCDSTITLHLTIKRIGTDWSLTDALCNGSATGSVTVSPNEGLAPFSYRIGTSGAYTQGGTSYTFTNLKAGSYRAYVQDATGCIGVVGPIIISQNDKVTATATSTPPTCYGSANGTITIDNPGGSEPFQYKIGSGGVLTSFTAPFTITGLIASNYCVYVIDANGCSSSSIVVPVTQPGKVSATLTSTDVTGCNGGSNGSLYMNNPIGEAPFMFKTTSGGSYAPFNPPLTFSGLTANNYSYYIQDRNGCVGKTNIATIKQPAPVPVSYSVVQPTCATPTGSISLSSTNTSGATYKISPGSSIYKTQSVYPNLAQGTYYGYAKDAAGCTGRSTAIVLSTGTICSTLMGRGIQQSNNETAGNTLSASISPNPSSHVFKLRANTAKTEAIQLRVIDINGKVVYTAKGSPTQTFSFGEALAIGIYMIELRQRNEMKTYKVVKTL